MSKQNSYPEISINSFDITARADAILADVRAQCQTLRRSMGQRFRKIDADRQERFNLSMMSENAWRLSMLSADLNAAMLRRHGA